MPTLQLAIDARGAKKGAQEFENASKKVQTSSKKGRDELGRFTKKFKGMHFAVGKLKLALGGLFVGFTAGMAVRAAIRTIAQFEETMTMLRGVAVRTNQTLEEQEKQFTALAKTARELGASTRFSATEAAEGLLFLARAGFSVQQSIEAIPATLNLAAVGGLALGEAADYASNILSQFNMAAEETVRVVDVLVITANRANTDVRQMAQAMKYVGPIAGALGIAIEDVAAAIGVLGDAGIQATMAGRGLRGALAALINPTNDMVDVIENLGLTLDDVDLRTNSLIEIFKKFADAGFTARDSLILFGRMNAAAGLIMAASTEKMGDLKS